MTYSCCICGKSIPEVGALYRVNEKGVAPIHACKEHRERAGWKADSELDEIVQVINPQESDEKILEDLGEEYTPLAFDPTNPMHVDIIRRVIPDMRKLEAIQNPLTRVMFRAGLLVMREMILQYAEIDDEEGNASIDALLAKESWPTEWLGPDPGTPRRLSFHEIVQGGEEGPWTEIQPTYTASIEALAEAHAFLVMMGVQENEQETPKATP